MNKEKYLNKAQEFKKQGKTYEQFIEVYGSENQFGANDKIFIFQKLMLIFNGNHINYNDAKECKKLLDELD